MLCAPGTGGADEGVDRDAENQAAEQGGKGVRGKVGEVPGEIVIAVVARMREERGGGGKRRQSENVGETMQGFHRMLAKLSRLCARVKPAARSCIFYL